MHRHKWGQYYEDLKHRRYGYMKIQIRQCTICDYKQYGIVRPKVHVIDMQGRNPTPVRM